MEKLIVHLTNEEQLIIENDYISINYYLSEFNDSNSNIKIGNYIIPKFSINYIEFVEEEKGEE